MFHWSIGSIKDCLDGVAYDSSNHQPTLVQEDELDVDDVIALSALDRGILKVHYLGLAQLTSFHGICISVDYSKYSHRYTVEVEGVAVRVSQYNAKRLYNHLLDRDFRLKAKQDAWKKADAIAKITAAVAAREAQLDHLYPARVTTREQKALGN